MTETWCHILGGLGFATDVVSLWLLGSRTSIARRRAGVLGMAIVNALFAVQGLLMDNWTLVGVSAMSAVLQTRAFLNWGEKSSSDA